MATLFRPKTNLGSDTKVIVGHVEMFWSARSGDRICVPCDCQIGYDHTHPEWKNRRHARRTRYRNLTNLIADSELRGNA